MERRHNETWPPRKPQNATARNAGESKPAKAKPNFSGEYVLDRDASKLEGGAASARGAVLRIDHYDPMIRIDAKFEFFDKTFAWSMQRTSDGREKINPSDPRNISSLRWDNDALLFTDRTTGPGAEVTMTWRYSLVDDEGRLQATEQIRGGGRDQDNIWIFARR
jgi:hypothetical protein